MGFQPKNIPFLKPSHYYSSYIPLYLIFFVPTGNKTIVGFLWAGPGSNYRITNNPSTISPSGYQKETQRTKCIVQSHPRWLLWVVVGIKCLQPSDGMCISLRGIRYTQLLDIKFPYIILILTLTSDTTYNQ
jgi:hypothetical protein